MRVLPDLNRIVEQCFNDGTLDDGDGFGQSVERIICKSGDKKYLIDCAGTENEIIEYQKNFWKNQIKQKVQKVCEWSFPVLIQTFVIQKEYIQLKPLHNH